LRAVGLERGRTPSLYVYREAAEPQFFRPTGYTGDCGDLHVTEVWVERPFSGKTCLKIGYDRKGAAPHACDYAGPCR